MLLADAGMGRSPQPIGVHRAYILWLPIYAAASLTVYLIWDRPWWHVTARHIIGV